MLISLSANSPTNVEKLTQRLPGKLDLTASFLKFLVTWATINALPTLFTTVVSTVGTQPEAAATQRHSCRLAVRFRPRTAAGESSISWLVPGRANSGPLRPQLVASFLILFAISLSSSETPTMQQTKHHVCAKNVPLPNRGSPRGSSTRRRSQARSKEQRADHGAPRVAGRRVTASDTP